jgi:hypothetical protein
MCPDFFYQERVIMVFAWEMMISIAFSEGSNRSSSVSLGCAANPL